MNFETRFRRAGDGRREFRPVPFWSWNDELDPEEIRRQIQLMDEAGFGGYFMHARRGLVTPYLGRDWMECVLAACNETRETPVLPWLYDEDCWPSGNAGGRVTSGRPEAQSKALQQELARPMHFRPRPETVALYAARRDKNDRLSHFRRIADLQAARSMQLEANEVLVHYFWQATDYVDVLNRSATQMFIESTHEEYRQLIGRYFGSVVPGVFTDEPLFRNAGGDAAWSEQLPEFFRRNADYDLLDHLPALFHDTPGAAKVRFDYYQTLVRLFVLAYTLPIYQWCDRHHLALTGHLMGEENLQLQAEYAGAVMPHYEYMHIPGIDQLRRIVRSPIAPKQASSVANQLGRRRVLSEMWGASGHNTTLEVFRWLADAQAVFGVNLCCPHLMLYSTRGCRKRDYPPTISYHQPWWPYVRGLNDTIARTMAAAAGGELVADVLVVHSATSAWTLGTRRRDELARIDRDLSRLARTLVGMHADFEFGDEGLMERHGRVEKGELVIEKRRYRTVVVPSSVNWKSSTLNLLKRFVRSGGSVLFAGRTPTMIDGEPSDAIEAFAADLPHVDITKTAGREALRKAADPKLRITAGRGKSDADQVAAMWRRNDDDNEHLIMLVNLDPDSPVDVSVAMPVKGAVHRLDPAGGGAEPADTKRTRTGQTTRLGLEAMGSALLRVAEGEAQPQIPTTRPRPRRTKVLARRWGYRRLDPNVLMLDRARPIIGERPHDELMPLPDINKMLLVEGAHTVIQLRFEFQCQAAPPRGGRLQLALERPDDHEIHLNGLRVPLRQEGWWIDRQTGLLDVSRLVSAGRNELIVRRPWTIDDNLRRRLLGQGPPGYTNRLYAPIELEPVYLVGDFAVAFDGSETGDAGPAPALSGPAGLNEGDRWPAGASTWMLGAPRMVPETESGTGQDLVEGGMPFFAGSVELTQTLMLDGNPSDRAVLEMDPPDAVVVTPVVNGQELESRWQRPFRWIVGEHLTKGKNELALRLTNSLRNLMGPHHHVAGELYGVSPSAFDGARRIVHGHMTDNPDFRADYNVVPLGLAGDVTLYY